MKNKRKYVTWTPDMEATLIQMWEDGKTSHEIGLVIGVSDNAIRKKANRMSLINQKTKCINPWDVLVSSLEDKPHQEPTGCRFIIGDPKSDWSYCQKPLVEDGKFSFCEEHYKTLVYVPEYKKKKKPMIFRSGVIR